MLHQWAGQLPSRESGLAPVAVSHVLEAEIARQLSAAPARPNHDDSAAGDSATSTVSVEPDAGAIRAAVSTLVNYRDVQAGPDPLAHVMQNAQLLERISSPEEVARMAEQLRSAMGVEATHVAAPSATTPAVDWDHALPSTAERIETEGRVEIHEMFVDRAGGATTMVHTRTIDPATGAFVYTVYLIESGVPHPQVICTQEDFEAAAERARPFEVINQFPLLRELHRSAIIPILEKLAPEAEAMMLSHP